MRSPTGFGRGAFFRNYGSALGSGSTFRIALISSLASSLLVAMLFLALGRGDDGLTGGSPVMAEVPALIETSERIINASEKVRPSVVSVINLTQQAIEADEADGEERDGDDILQNASLGSGVIFDKKGGKAYIITNTHVLQDAAEVQIVLVGGERKKADIVGTDIVSDLAVLAIDGAGIDDIVEIGSSDKLRVGEMVIAIGNPLGFGDTLTQGIVSSTNRIIPISLNQDGIYDWEQAVIQTDAAINQGNSGGALIDLNGRLVGINSMKIADYGVEGIGFALPIDGAMPVIESLMEKGKVSRPYLGVYTVDLSLYLDSPSPEGEDAEEEVPLPVVPKGVKKGIIVLESVGPAKEAGLKFNDIIVSLDSKPVDSTLALRKYLYNSKKIGDILEVEYYRDGKPKTAKIKLGEKSDKDE